MTASEMAHRVFVAALFPLVFRAATDPVWLLALEIALGLVVVACAHRLTVD